MYWPRSYYTIIFKTDDSSRSRLYEEAFAMCRFSLQGSKTQMATVGGGGGGGQRRQSNWVKPAELTNRVGGD